MTKFSASNSAEVIAIQAAGWILSQDDLSATFLETSGLDPETLRAGLGDAEILAAVLDFLFLNDNWVLGFCGDAGLSPEQLTGARASLPGGDAPFWT